MNTTDYARWVAALCAPYTTLHQARWAAHATRTLAHDDHDRFAAFISGITWQILATLPDDDPWRVYKPSDGRAFTVRTHMADLMPLSGATISEDPILSCLEGDLDSEHTTILLQAQTSIHETYRMLRALNSDKLAYAAPIIVRWALVRRWCYVGGNDEYVSETCTAWIRRSAAYVQGGNWQQDAAIFEAALEQIPHGFYEKVTHTRY